MDNQYQHQKRSAKLVTRTFMFEQLEKDPIKLVGRSLVAILKNQTAEEGAGNKTKLRNGIGFTKPDARVGSITAKYYLKHKTLEDWQLKVWTTINDKGLPKILKYTEQLNKIATWNKNNSH